MPPDSNIASKSGLTLYRPSLRATLILVPVAAAALGVALFLRYGIIQNTPIGLGCEAGEESFTCIVRFAAILLFTWEVFGWAAVAAALVQLWRPNIIAFGIGVVFAALGLVLYNTRLSALAVALLVISLARAAPKAR
jgi:Gpi18-like mannosyltransferase